VFTRCKHKSMWHFICKPVRRLTSHKRFGVKIRAIKVVFTRQRMRVTLYILTIVIILLTSLMGIEHLAVLVAVLLVTLLLLIIPEEVVAIGFQESREARGSA